MQLVDVVMKDVWAARFVATDTLLGFIVFILAIILGLLANPIGGFIYALISAPIFIPIIGKFYNILFIRILRISYLSKIIAMMISASGIFIFVELIYKFAPRLLEIRAVLIGLMTAVCVATLDVLHRMHLMEMPNFEDHIESAAKFLPMLKSLPEEERVRLRHVGFAEATIIGLFVIVISFGLALYIGDALGIFARKGVVSSPMAGIFAALKSIQIDISPQTLPSGFWAIFIRGIFGISLLIYIVFFLAIAPNLIAPSAKPEIKDILEAFVSGFSAHASREATEPPKTDAPPARFALRILERSPPYTHGNGRTRYPPKGR